MPDNPQNPTIAQQGQANITPGQSCTWSTANGSNSSITITNPSRANVCLLAITGAPGTGIIVSVNNQMVPSLNNIYTVPPNAPSFTIMATGNFGGSTVTIANMTNAQTPATANIVAQTTQPS